MMKKLNVNFCYFVHCLAGRKTHYENLKVETENLFKKLFVNEEDKDTKNIVACYCNEANSGFSSNFSLEIMFDNAYNEFINYFEETFIKDLKKDEDKYNKFEGVECNIYLTFSGHSIGGNVSRGLINKLYSKFLKDNETFDTYFQYIQKKYSFISNIIPCSYIAISSPHLGSLVTKNREANIKFIKRSEKTVVNIFTNTVVGDVGKELTFQDEKVKKPKPTSTEQEIENMEEKISKHVLINHCSKKAMAALAQFPNRTLTAHLRNDVQVKYCSAMGCLESPFPHIIENEKELLIKDSTNDVRIVSFSGFGENEELEYYQKEVFNEKISPAFFYPDTKYEPNIDIDKQIKQALENKSQTYQDNKENYEEMEDVFVTDNDIQQDIPVALVKKFNQISYRRVSLDLLIPFSKRLLTHSLDLGYPTDSFFKPNAYTTKISNKCISFYSHLIIADFIKTSGQTDTYSLSSINNQ
ncbi:hypothetical protein BCR36DRAFT_332024 [Piromyces finnis]|uniref:DUF676 domain-containing protein n=1 Tax=Piromyces finnis TaxID=1754191 RepID=A0A1Y1V3X8_9FUNG|nr:hypothetical protein BCR36DRAFT_332024 [Piromyces finnis]|eukprot:ORX46145.1 hypothetical protein BCR36DRAFT_332024 [Piromyces finnis]